MVTLFFLWFLVWSPIVYQKKEVSSCFLDEFFQCQVNMRYPKKPIESRIIHKFFTAKVELFILCKSVLKYIEELLNPDKNSLQLTLSNKQ
jgi:hypothetical protein